MTRPPSTAVPVLVTLSLLLAAPAAAQVGSWAITGRGSGTGSAFGSNPACDQGNVSASRHLEGTLALFEDGTYRKPGGRACRRSSTVLPDEVGTWRPGRKPRSVVLEPTNLDELAAALGPAVADCSRAPVTVDIRRLRLRTTFRVSADGQTLRGVERDSITGSFRVLGVRCGFRVNVEARFRGSPGLSSATGAFVELRGGPLQP